MKSDFVGVFAGLFLLFAGSVYAEESTFAAAQKRLKTVAPEEYAKIEKLAQTDMEAAMQGLRDLARQKQVELPRPRRNNGRMDRRDSGFDGQRGRGFGGQGNFERRRPDGGQEGRPAGAPNGGGRPPMMFARLNQEIELSKKYPAEYTVWDQKSVAAEQEYLKLAEKAGVEPISGMEDILRALRRKAGAEFDAVWASFQNNPKEGIAKLSQLAEKHGVKLPMFGRRGGMPPENGQTGEAPREGNNSRRIGRVDLADLHRRYPEEMKEYDRLLNVDRRAAQQLLRKIIEKDK